MKVQMTHNGKTVEVELTDEQFEKLFTEKKTGYERVEVGELYYSVNALSNPQKFTEDNASYDKTLFDCANYYSGKTVAENMARAQRLWNKIHRRAIELCEPVCVSEVGSIYQIVFMVRGNNIIPLPRSGTRSFGTVWFDTEEHCEQVIDEFHDELLWYFTLLKDRADM